MKAVIGGSFSGPPKETSSPAFSAALMMTSIANTNKIGDIVQPISIPTFMRCQLVVYCAVVKRIWRLL